MIRKASISLAALMAGALAAALALSVSTGHAASHHPAVSASQARAALQRYLLSYSPTVKWTQGVRPGTPHVGVAGYHGAKVGSVTSVGSYNWGGYASSSTTAQTFTKVSASWTVPKATCTAEDRLAVIWVGLDGLTTTTVEQDGTLDWCYKGTAHYYTWYEMYPAGSVDVGEAAAAGDKITASVSRSGTSYTLALTDSTHSKESFTKTATCALTTCKDESAEWIVERPSFTTTGMVPLAQIATVTVNYATATANGKSEPISKSPSPEEIDIFDSTDDYHLWAPTALGAKGDYFHGTWLNSF
jgi:Peptidase A4 family